MTDFDPAPLEITLFRGWSDKDCYVWSPFVTKLELRLRLSNVSYQTAAGSMRTAPTGKIPYVDVREEEQPTSTTSAIGDSAMIAQYLAGRGLIHDLDANLGASSKAQDLAIRALVEDRLYFFNVCLIILPARIPRRTRPYHVVHVKPDARTLDGQLLHPA